VIGALLALVATIVVLIAIAHAFAVSSPVCHGVSPGDVRTGDSVGTLTGYRLP